MLSIHQRLSQLQKLSPQQIQYQKLLQLNTLSLEQRIKTELELNPILEEQLLDDFEQDMQQEEVKPEESLSDDNTEHDDEVESSSDDEFEIEDFMNDADVDNDYLNRNDDEERTQPIAPRHETLSEHLISQLSLLNLSDDLYMLGEEIIGNLNEDGYLKRDLQSILDELILFQHVEISFQQAEHLLHQIQTLDPNGIASRNLQECLLIQIKNSSFDPYYSYLAEKLLTEYFNDFINKRFDAIQKNMNLTLETLKSILKLIHKLNPKPGEGNIESDQANQITPDFIIEKVDDNFIISLNDRHVPSVTISTTYLEMLNSNKRKRNISPRDKETHKFL
ncbi:MAG: RNA polymerase sigma-54 factor, partial [Methanococcaceae archaeon]